jgi:hypothetical protein
MSSAVENSEYSSESVLDKSTVVIAALGKSQRVTRDSFASYPEVCAVAR